MKLHKLWAALGTALAVFPFAIAVVLVPPAQAQTYSLLYTFNDYHGHLPLAGLAPGPHGSLYGTTVDYLPGVNRSRPQCCGSVYQLTSHSGYTRARVLHKFTADRAAVDGAYPMGKVIAYQGSLYSTTSGGGAYGAGVVFKVDLARNYTVLYTFTGGADGAGPTAGLVQDAVANMYGTAPGGGAYGYGVVFKLDQAGNYSVLYNFTGGGDGAGPVAALVLDAAGRTLYGTTPSGGLYGAGVVFKLDVTGNYTVLYHFTGGADGAKPLGHLVLDSVGNLYGTTYQGGDPYCGCGVVFKLEIATGTMRVLHAFPKIPPCRFQFMPDGGFPAAGVVLDAVGNLYGTTELGGLLSGGFPCQGKHHDGCGVVFKIDPVGNFSVLYAFRGPGHGYNDGKTPVADLLLDAKGNLYGTTRHGGVRKGTNHFAYGTVFKITP